MLRLRLSTKVSETTLVQTRRLLWLGLLLITKIRKSLVLGWLLLLTEIGKSLVLDCLLSVLLSIKGCKTTQILARGLLLSLLLNARIPKSLVLIGRLQLITKACKSGLVLIRRLLLWLKCLLLSTKVSKSSLVLVGQLLW